jgi:hypothetical protein
MNFDFNLYADPAFYYNADPDPASKKSGSMRNSDNFIQTDFKTVASDSDTGMHARTNGDKENDETRKAVWPTTKKVSERPYRGFTDSSYIIIIISSVGGSGLWRAKTETKNEEIYRVERYTGTTGNHAHVTITLKKSNLIRSMTG